MVCYSSIKTLLTDEARLREALLSLGYTVSIYGQQVTGKNADGRIITFDRARAGDAYTLSGDTTDQIPINRRYAEIGVRSWARKNGFSIAENDGRKITLHNRRG